MPLEKILNHARIHQNTKENRSFLENNSCKLCMMVVQNDKMCEQTSGLTDFMKNVTAFTHYSFEIYDYLFEKERSNIIIRKRSDQINIRPQLVEILKKFTKQQKFHPMTLHLGEFRRFLRI